MRILSNKVKQEDDRCQKLIGGGYVSQSEYDEVRTRYQRSQEAVKGARAAVSGAEATVLVKVRFLDKDVRMLPDMSAKVSFLSRELTAEELKPRLAVNQSALVRVKEKILFIRFRMKRFKVKG